VDWPFARRALRAEVIGLAVIAAVAVLLIWSRIANLGTSLWHDEAFTILTHINEGPRHILFDDYRSNNHVLFSLLSWATTGVIGHFETGYRIWSVVPGLAAVALLGWWAWRRFEPLAAAAVIVLLTVSPMHLDLTPQARGYGLVFLAEAGLLVSGVRATDSGRVANLGAFAFFGVMGTATYPAFGLVFASQGLALLVRRELRRPILVGSAFAAVAALLLYAPISDAVKGSVTMERLSYGWLHAPFTYLARPSLATLLPARFAETPLLVAIFGVLVVLGGSWLWRRGDGAVLLQLTVPVVASCPVLLAVGLDVVPRFGSFLLLHVIVMLAMGVVAVWELARRIALLRIVLPIAAMASIVLGSADVIRITRQEATTPYENFERVGDVVRATGIQTVVTNSPRPQGLWYYVGRDRVRVVADESRLGDVLCTTRRPLVFIDHRFRERPEADSSCLRRRGSLAFTSSNRRADPSTCGSRAAGITLLARPCPSARRI
jgi:hypothetical protein